MWENATTFAGAFMLRGTRVFSFDEQEFCLRTRKPLDEPGRPRVTFDEFPCNPFHDYLTYAFCRGDCTRLLGLGRGEKDARYTHDKNHKRLRQMRECPDGLACCGQIHITQAPPCLGRLERSTRLAAHYWFFKHQG